MQTQTGIGAIPIEQAAGSAFRLASSTGLVGQKHEEDSGLFASGQWVRDAAPVVLPLPKAWIAVWTALSIALLPLAIWAMVAITNRGTEDIPADRASSRSDVVSPAPRAEPSAAAPPVAQPSAPSGVRRGTDPGVQSGPKQRSAESAQGRRKETKRHAPPKARPMDDDWVPRGP